MDKTYHMADSLNEFDLQGYSASIREWKGSKALACQQNNAAIFLHEKMLKPPYRVCAEVAIADAGAMAGIAFGGIDPSNYELVYLSAGSIRYQPVMNGSMTWQVYCQPHYRRQINVSPGTWQKLTIDVYQEGVIVFLGDDPEPKISPTKLIHEGRPGKIGIWSHLAAYIRKVSIQDIPPLYFMDSIMPPGQPCPGLVTEWLLSQPFNALSLPMTGRKWIKASTEENGTLNVHRYYGNEQGNAIEARGVVFIPNAQATQMLVSFSDYASIWINEQLVSQTEHICDGDSCEGTIQEDTFKIEVNWRAGLNMVRVVLRQNEGFGWGIRLDTKLSGMSLLTSAGIYFI